MGREQRRREEKKNRNKKDIEENELLDTTIHGVTVLKVCFATILILFVLYYVLAVFITKEIDISEKSDKADTSDTSSANVSDKIIAANIFRQSEETYYVYCYDFNEEDEGVAQAIGSAKEKVYRVNTSEGLNSKYVTEAPGNANASGLDNLKVSNPTLLVISADKIVGYYEGRSNIITFLSA